MFSLQKNLGVVLDDCEMCFTDHISNIVKSSFLIIRKLSQIKGYLTEEQLQQLVSSDVFSKLDYCNSLFYGINSALIRKMQHVQNCAARLVSKTKIPSGSLDKFITDKHWLKVKFRPLYKILLIVHNCLQENAPEEIFFKPTRVLVANRNALTNKIIKKLARRPTKAFN